MLRFLKFKRALKEEISRKKLSRFRDFSVKLRIRILSSAKNAKVNSCEICKFFYRNFQK